MTNFAIFFPLLTIAVQRLPGGVAAAVGGITPLLVCVLTATFERRTPATSDLAWTVFAAIGVAFVVIRSGAGFDRVDILAAIGANVSFAVGTVITKRIVPTADGVTLTGQQLLVAAVVLVPLSLIVDGIPTTPKPSELLGLTYLAGVATAVAFVRWFDGIRRLPTAAPPLLGLLAPLTGTVIGWTWLGQTMTPPQIIGFAVTATTIAAGTSRRRAPHRTRHPQHAWVERNARD